MTLLKDAILIALSQVEPGRGVTARKVAKTVGDDIVRVGDELKRLERAELVRGREVKNPLKPQEKPYRIFLPVYSAIQSALQEKGLS